MTTIDENGAIVMDTDFAPENAREVKLNQSEGPTKFIVLKSIGTMEDHSGVLLKDTEEVRQFAEENNLTILASGVSEVSLAELSYSLQAPARQLYRATMADITELLDNRFIQDDYAMRTICNKNFED